MKMDIPAAEPIEANLGVPDYALVSGVLWKSISPHI